MQIFWLTIAAVAGLWTVGLFRAHLRRLEAAGRLYERMQRIGVPAEPPSGISLIIPIRGLVREDTLRDALNAVESLDAELVIAIEGPEDLSWPMAEAALRAQPGARARMVATGICPAHHNGKVHNLIGGIASATGDTLFFADADVFLTGGAHLILGASLLNETGVGAVFAPPYYVGAPTLAARFAAAYTNTQFAPSMPRADQAGALQYCAGAFYGLKRSTYERIGGFEPLLGVVSDDAYLGRAVVAAGLGIRLIPCTAQMIADPMSWGDAIDHLRRWVLLGRIFAPASFRRSLLSFLVPIALLTAVSLQLAGGSWVGGAWFIACVALLVRIYAAYDHAFIFQRLPLVQHLCGIALDLVMPLLWLDAALARTMVWRGRRYRLGKDGRLVG